MKPSDAERYIDATAAVLQLPLRPEHRPGVLRYFELAAGFAAVVEAVPLSSHHESAVGFTPVSPEDAER